MSDAEADAVAGWYYISETWSLYVDGDLQQVPVEYIQVTQKTTGDGYSVRHYDQTGDMVTVVSLDYDDLRPVTLDREESDRPAHL